MKVIELHNILIFILKKKRGICKCGTPWGA